MIHGDNSSNMQRRFHTLSDDLVLCNIHSRHHPVPSTRDHPPAQHHTSSNRQNLFKIGLIEEHHLQTAGLIFDTDLQYAQSSISCPFCFTLSNYPTNRRHRPRNKISDGCHDRSIFIPPGDGPEHILYRFDAQPLEDSSAFGSNPFGKSNRKPPELGSSAISQCGFMNRSCWQRLGSLRLLHGLSKSLDVQPRRMQSATLFIRRKGR